MQHASQTSNEVYSLRLRVHGVETRKCAFKLQHDATRIAPGCVATPLSDLSVVLMEYTGTSTAASPTSHRILFRAARSLTMGSVPCPSIVFFDGVVWKPKEGILAARISKKTAEKFPSNSTLLLPLIYATTKDQVTRLHARITKEKENTKGSITQLFSFIARDESAHFALYRGGSLVIEEEKGLTVDSAAVFPLNSPPVTMILRGIPGSGKSQLSRAVLERLGIPESNAEVCSADKFFEVRDPKSGLLIAYNWNMQQLSDAHRWCQHRYEEALTDTGNSLIIIDNVCAKKWTYSEYIKLAKSHGGEVVILDLRCSNKSDVDICARRNVHGVDSIMCRRMWGQWERDDQSIMINSPVQGEGAAKELAALLRGLIGSSSQKVNTNTDISGGRGKVPPLATLHRARSDGLFELETAKAKTHREKLVCSVPQVSSLSRMRQRSAVFSINSSKPAMSLRSASTSDMGRDLFLQLSDCNSPDDVNSAVLNETDQARTFAAKKMGRAGLIYAALFLDAASRARVSELISISFPKRPLYDHVTLKYGISVEDYEAYISPNLGSIACFRVKDIHNRVMTSDGVQVLLLPNPSSSIIWRGDNQRLHLTLSLAEGESASRGHDLARMVTEEAMNSSTSHGSACGSEDLLLEGILGVVVFRRGRTETVFDPSSLKGWNLRQGFRVRSRVRQKEIG